jgi:hypothetical protein
MIRSVPIHCVSIIMLIQDSIFSVLEVRLM